MEIRIEWSQHDPELAEDVTAHILRLEHQLNKTDGEGMLELLQDIQSLFVKLGEVSFLEDASRIELAEIGREVYSDLKLIVEESVTIH